MDSDQTFAEPFSGGRGLIGMLHIGALPGTPRSRRTVRELASTAVAEARLLASSGFDGLLMENMHDRPYLAGEVGPEIVAALSVIGAEIRAAVDLPLGVQILAGANREALAVALACGASFVRVEGFVFAHLGDEGWHEAAAGDLLRYRRSLDAESIRIFADIKKKHASHAVSDDLSLVDTAKAAEFFLADGVVVTGAATGEPASPGDVRDVAAATSLWTLVGSGVTAENIAEYRAADALIVGSSLKKGGDWRAEMDPHRADALVEAFRR